MCSVAAARPAKPGGGNGTQEIHRNTPYSLPIIVLPTQGRRGRLQCDLEHTNKEIKPCDPSNPILAASRRGESCCSPFWRSLWRPAAATWPCRRDQRHRPGQNRFLEDKDRPSAGLGSHSFKPVIPAYTKVTRDYLLNAKTGDFVLKWVQPDKVPSDLVMNVSKILNRVLAREKPAGYAFSENDFLPAGTRPGMTAGVPPGSVQLRSMPANSRACMTCRRATMLISWPVFPSTCPARPFEFGTGGNERHDDARYAAVAETRRRQTAGRGRGRGHARENPQLSDDGIFAHAGRDSAYGSCSGIVLAVRPKR